MKTFAVCARNCVVFTCQRRYPRMAKHVGWSEWLERTFSSHTNATHYTLGHEDGDTPSKSKAENYQVWTELRWVIWSCSDSWQSPIKMPSTYKMWAYRMHIKQAGDSWCDCTENLSWWQKCKAYRQLAVVHSNVCGLSLCVYSHIWLFTNSCCVSSHYVSVEVKHYMSLISSWKWCWADDSGELQNAAETAEIGQAGNVFG